VSASAPTALNAVFRRISNEARTRASFANGASGVAEFEPKLIGFGEPAETLADASPEPDAPAEPDAEDIVALLAAQPEVAPWIDTLEVRRSLPPRPATVSSLRIVSVPDPVAELAEPEPGSEAAVAPAPIAEPPAEAVPEPEPAVEPEPAIAPASAPASSLEPQSGSPRFEPWPPEPSESPSPQEFATRPSAQVVSLAPRPYRPLSPTSAPEPADAETTLPDPQAPAYELPPRPPVDVRPELDPASLSSPVTDRNGRQSMRNRRLYRRVRLGAEIEINGNPASLVDISIGGFAAADISGVYPNTIVPVVLRLTIDGIEVGTRLHARIVYAIPERVSGRFIDLTASQTAFLRYIVTWRGESVGTVGTTTLLDAITGGPLKGLPPGSSNADAPRERWWAGLIGWKINPPR